MNKRFKFLTDNTNNKQGTIMLQGTASDVGKSLIVTALCRILSNQNKTVAPFKSWNMSLNSYVTPGGGEIGIAQALQAKAAGQKPQVDMQPILVKPKGDGVSQVILKGKPAGDCKYDNKTDYLADAEKTIKESLSNLLEKYDNVIMEGAGSPVEINRKNKDLANMKVAKMYNTPVILVANIDRGGALASIVGTLRLLEPEERKLVQGIIINKFRGDIDLLKSGIDFLENYTGKPVLGVIPYIRDLKLPEEDSASLQNGLSDTVKEDIQIGVINLPHMSNFTDFKALEMEFDVHLSYINDSSRVNKMDLIIIPGTKTTTKDLKYIKKNGLDKAIIQSASKGVPVIGICGGYQMLGKTLLDRHQTEGQINQLKGLGLLPIETEFLPEKTTHQVKATINNRSDLLSEITDKEINGYEIHMGQTNYLDDINYVFKIEKQSGHDVSIKDGAINKTGNCFGTYIHGLFDNDSFRRGILNKIRKRKGLNPLSGKHSSYNQMIEGELDRLSEIVRDNLDMNYIRNLLNIE